MCPLCAVQKRFTFSSLSGLAKKKGGGGNNNNVDAVGSNHSITTTTSSIQVSSGLLDAESVRSAVMSDVMNRRAAMEKAA